MFGKSRSFEDGFKLGFEKAWDMMIPIMMDGISKMKQQIYDQAINEYRQAANLKEAGAIIKKWSIPAAITIAGVGQAGRLIRDLMQK